MKCLNCHHWALKGSPLRDAGFGTCAVEPNELLRKAKTTSPDNVCRIDRFKPASVRVVESRRKALGMAKPSTSEGAP